MPNIDIEELTMAMFTAAKGKLQPHLQEAGSFLQAETRKLAITAAQIEAGHVTGELTDAQTKILLKMQANASQAVLTAIETVGMIAAQDAINAALDVLRAAVNASIGIALL